MDGRRYIPIVVLTAVVTAAATVGGPAVTGAVYDAMNADRVDGRHAVGPGASAEKRAGNLVAMNRQGRLPKSLHVDAETLDGFDVTELVHGNAWVFGGHHQVNLGEWDIFDGSPGMFQYLYVCPSSPDLPGDLRVLNETTGYVDIFVTRLGGATQRLYYSDGGVAHVEDPPGPDTFMWTFGRDPFVSTSQISIEVTEHGCSISQNSTLTHERPPFG